MINKWIVISAIAALTAIEIVAMAMGYNGLLRSIIVAAICGLAGWIGLPQPRESE